MEQWERQSGESARAFQAFTIYRDLGPDRSITVVARKLRKQAALISRWCSQWRWVRRVEAYDSHLDALRRKAREKSIERAERRQLRISRALQAKAAERLKGLQASDLKPRDMITAITEGIKLERLVLGQATEQISGRFEPVIVKMWQPPKTEGATNGSPSAEKKEPIKAADQKDAS